VVVVEIDEKAAIALEGVPVGGVVDRERGRDRRRPASTSSRQSAAEAQSTQVDARREDGIDEDAASPARSAAPW
jgi:hypothetical protein